MNFCTLDKGCHRNVTFLSDGANLSSTRLTIHNNFYERFQGGTFY
jgi:hypothetical protein